MTDFDKIEQQKSKLLTELSEWSDARLHNVPGPGSWSAAQMLDHIVKVEIGILAAARNGLRSPHRIGLRDRIGFIFLDRVFLSARQVKAPASATGIFPCNRPNCTALASQWSSARLELKEFYSQIPLDFNRGIFRHPVSGWMTPQQIIRFFSVHLIHHEFQLSRLRASSNGL